nr:MAG TPA_asm: hypothetical protein [Caudoviricetes sp.]
MTVRCGDIDIIAIRALRQSNPARCATTARGRAGKDRGS